MANMSSKVVDLKDKKILRWEAVKDAHGMVLLDDFNTVQQIINEPGIC